MADVQSVTIFVMTAGLPWSDDARADDARGADALGALDPVALFEGARQCQCGIRKISALGTTIRGPVSKAAGDAVAIELATGQRPAGTIDWVAGGEAGIRFARPIDMMALLNRKLVAQATERRTMPRVELRCGVGIKWSGNLASAQLRNISAKGLQVEGEDLPPRDSFISLFIDGLVVPAGEVVWRKGNLAGIELMDELKWSSIMPWIREVGRRGAG